MVLGCALEAPEPLQHATQAAIHCHFTSFSYKENPSFTIILHMSYLPLLEGFWTTTVNTHGANNASKLNKYLHVDFLALPLGIVFEAFSDRSLEQHLRLFLFLRPSPDRHFLISGCFRICFTNIFRDCWQIMETLFCCNTFNVKRRFQGQVGSFFIYFGMILGVWGLPEAATKREPKKS